MPILDNDAKEKMFASACADLQNRNYASARNTFWFLAGTNYENAVYELAIMCEQGLGAEPNKVDAYKWFSIAEKLLHKDAGIKRAAIEANMNNDEINKGDDFVQEWIETHP